MDVLQKQGLRLRPTALHVRAMLAALSAALTVSTTIAAEPSAGHVRELGDLSIKELMELEVDSVYGASRYVQKTSRAPASISVITADEITGLGARTLGDVLSSVRGLYVPNDRNYAYLGIRGFHRPNDYNTRVLVLIDGHRMNDNIYDQGSVGREMAMDVDLIERVEVIRGPSSSIYGSSAFFGVINVVTKRAGPLDGIEASAAAGSFDTFKSRVTVAHTFDNDIEWVVSASRYNSAGPNRLYFPEFDQRISSDPRAANNGVAENLDGEEATKFFTSLRYNDFTFSAAWSDRTKEIPTASFETMFNKLEESVDTRAYLDLKYDHQFNDRLWLQARLFYDDYRYSGIYPYDFAEPGSAPDVVPSIDDTVGRWAGTEWQLTAKLPERHTVIVGGEYRDNLREYQITYYDTDPRVYDLLDDRSSSTLGLFAQSETTLTSNLLLTAGVRYDHYSDDLGDTLNPRLGLIYSPSETGTLKALYGEAFRAPNPYERHYYPEQSNRPELDAETIQTYELVYEKQLPSQYRLIVSGYYYDVNDLISQAATDDEEIYFANLDSARAKGVEIEVDRRFDSGALVRASYALQEAVDGQTRVDLSSSPRHMAKLKLSVPFFNEKLVTGLELQYHGSARTLAGNRADDFLTANLTLFNRSMAKGLEISGTIYNLFDARYGYPGAEDHLQEVIEQDGRAFLGKLSYRF